MGNAGVGMTRENGQFAQIHLFNAKKFQLQDLVSIVNALCAPLSDGRRLPNGRKQKGQEGEEDGSDHGGKFRCLCRPPSVVVACLSPTAWGKVKEKSRSDVSERDQLNQIIT